MARPARRPGNLPAEATTFVGRRRELSEVRRKLVEARLVSLVGAGGVGKTRLAIRSAANVARGFAGGVWLIELGELRDPALVANAAVAALDLRDQAATEPADLVLSYLRDRQLLLVIDNCEHLLEAAAGFVSEVIASAPGVRVIATSREPLTVAGEHVVPVPPLELPSPQTLEPLSRLRQNEAILLFTERASAAAGSFELTMSNRAAVVDLCRRLDGLPLAIELAAVRTRVLSVEQILDRLADRFALLTAGGRAALPRHQTLRTAIDWSYDLLSDAERILFRRLCGFAGRFTLEDVEGVGVSERALDLVSSLVDKSLVIKEEVRGLACYRLHETMREYGAGKLTEAGEQESIEERCVDYYLMRCTRSASEARYRIVEWLGWLELEIDNIRFVLQRCVAHRDVARGIPLALSVAWYWFTRATNEGVRWLDELLMPGTGSAAWSGWPYFIRGFLSVLQADPSAARPWLARASEAARETGQADLLAQALAMASIAENMLGERQSAGRLLDEARAASNGLNDVPAALGLLQAVAIDGLLAGDPAVVSAASAEGARLSRESGDLYGLEMMLMNQGTAALIARDFEAAEPRFVESLRIANRIDDRVAQYYLLDALGCLAAASGQARRAAHLLGAAETVRVRAGARVISTIAPLVDQAEKSGVAALGASRFEAELEGGKQLSREAAVALAIGDMTESPALSRDHASAPQLGKRESEVALLVAEGLSNKQIGARLVISKHTVDSHIRSIMNKLGANSRAQIAAWMASSRDAMD
jgi:predicted ATPase/DNA-binding CsgD family transcriptional regulator